MKCHSTAPIVKKKAFQRRHMSTSTGVRGGKTVLALAHLRLSRDMPNIPCFALPSYKETFDEEKGITEATHLASFNEALEIFLKQL
jgi:hypothetical protein